MKKVLFAAALFFAGLFLLRELERRSDWSPEPLEADVTLVHGLDDEPAPGGIGVRVRGHFQADLYNSESTSVALSVRSKDSRTEGDGDHLFDVVLNVFDEETGEKVERARIHADEARLPRDASSGLEPRYEKKVWLNGVEGALEDLFRGSTLDISTPAATVDFSDPGHVFLESDGEIHISSSEFEAGGTGYQLDVVRADAGPDVPLSPQGREDVIELAENGWMEFRPEEGSDDEDAPLRSGRIEATGSGPLQIRREGDTEPHPIAFEVWEGGRLQLLGEVPWTLTGDHLVVRGESTESAERIRPIHVTVEGKAVWTSGESVFSGEEGTIDFRDDGRFQSAVIDGLARAQIQTSFISVVKGISRSTETTLHVRSDGSIEVRSENGGTIYRVAGPATVDTPGIRIRSNGDLTGTRSNVASDEKGDDSRNERLALHGTGGVRVETENGSLETADFVLRTSFTEDGEALVRGTASGGARLVGTDEVSGRSFTITSPRSLEVERRGNSLRLLEGENVEISVSDSKTQEEVFFARCDRLSDLSVEEQTFLAEGNVLYRRKESEATCARLESFGADHFQMWGDKSRRAEFRSPLGTARAEEVDVDAGRVHAHGKVEAEITSVPEDVEIDLDSYDLACEDLVAYRSKSKLDDGTFLRRFTLDAAGDVHTRVETGTSVLDLTHADALHAVREDQLTASRGGGERRIGSFTELTARGTVEAEVLRRTGGASAEHDVESDLHISSDTLGIRRNVAEEGASAPEISVLASGNVRFQGSRQVDFHGEGDLLRIDPDSSGHLDPAEQGPGEKPATVRLFGILPTHGLPFQLVARRVDFTADRIEAEQPDLVVSNAEAAPKTGARAPKAIAYRARAERLIATEESFELLGNVRLDGATKRSVPWTLEAKRIDLQGSSGAPDHDPAELSKISATGGIVFRLGDNCTARADALFGVRPTGVLHMIGSPAQIEFLGRREEAEWIDFDPELGIILEAGRGTTFGESSEPKGEGSSKKKQSPGGSGGQSGAGGPALGGPLPAPLQDSASDSDEPWSLEKLWLTTRVDQDSFVICVQEPVFRYPAEHRMLRASWAILWVNRKQLEELSSGEKEKLNDDAHMRFAQASLGPMRVFFDMLEERGVSGLVQEAYFEGPVETYENGLRTARADAVYLDLTSGHGWLSNATLNVYGGFLGKELERVTIRAKWLRHSSDGSLRADNATVTSCDFEVPHVQIATGDLRLTPLPDDVEPGYEISLRDNRVEMYDLPELPLPSLAFDTDPKLKPQIPSFRFGNSARFGQLFGFQFTRPAKKLGRFFHDLFSREGSKKGEGAGKDGKKGRRRRRGYEARYDLDASYLGSRGVLLDLGFITKDRNERYGFDFRSGFTFDNGRDRGYVRVPEEERSSLRLWLRSHGWLVRGDDEFRLAYTDQSDPGVQAEFFEKDFANWEEYENYVQWKRRRGSNFSQVSIQPRVDNFQADVEELPSSTFFRGRRPIAHIGSTSILHSGELDAAYLRRRSPRRFDTDGDGLLDGPILSPFQSSGVFPGDLIDPTGNHDVVRADLTQTLEAPIALGTAGLNLVPFVRARGTGWDRAAAGSDASRLVAEAGARLSTVFWKELDNGTFHQVSPYLGVRRQVGSRTRGVPHVFDGTENALYGDFVELGMRSRFGVEGDRSRLDFDLRTVYASDRSDGKRDGWLPVETFTRFGIAPGGRVFDIWYDGRFDAEEGEFVYSLFSLGTRFGDDAGLQIGHTYGRDASFQKIFDAATISGFYRWSEKWEVEARQTLSLLANSRLGTGFVLRRYGHDVIFELETSYRNGEGSTINMSVRPRLGFKPSRIGYIHW